MRELTFSKSGVIWRLASVYGPLDECIESTDICTYWQAAFRGACMVLILTICAGVVAASFGDLLALLAAMAVSQSFISPNDVTVIALAISLVVAFFASLAVVLALTDSLKSSNVTPSFIREAYASWKQKTCVKVNLNGR